ncbi:chitin synthase chs-2 [Galendromus occidentalis]|uniref:chitin synthase n=1 Tax=Galendromus occidentalis TaxID=34638 RepID=A0AAJ7WH48_9ACAR|nr:chitin synthase chs-2 [Galendromus occidentalis]
MSQKYGQKDGIFSESQENDDVYDDDESTPLYAGSQRKKTEGWDVFQDPPPPEEDDTINPQWIDVSLKITKVIVYILTATIVLSTSIIAKGAILFITSHVGQKTVPVCRQGLPVERDKDYQAIIPPVERIAWVWSLFLVLIMPELFTLFRACRVCFFKSYRPPNKDTFIMVLVMESLHVLGMVLLVFVVLPEMDVVKAAMLTNCMCFIPALFGMLSHYPGEEKRALRTLLDFFCLCAQAMGFFVWPFVVESEHSWTIPVSCLLVSCRWWENYVDKRSSFGLIARFGRMKDDLRKSRYFSYIFISAWKVLLYFSLMLFVNMITMENVVDLLRSFAKAFRSHQISIVQVYQRVFDQLPPDIPTASPLDDDISLSTFEWTPIIVAMIQICAAHICYVSSKFACKICIQGFSFAFPISLTIPVSISLLIASCGIRFEDVCFFDGWLPKYLFWKCPTGEFFQDFITTQNAWVWLVWLLSQTWIAVHIWTPKSERLSSTEKLFVCPMYVGTLIDQSLAFNRRRDDEGELKSDELALDGTDDYETMYETISESSDKDKDKERKVQQSTVKASDHVTKIYACATMWHETTDEMVQLLKSIMRMDEDQCARRIAQKYLRIVDPDYYEFEVHVLFDDAFEWSDHSDEDRQVNRFVTTLVKVMDTAASNVHQTPIKLKPPKKIPTPYGGRLVWTMPGKNKFVVHMKDKNKIRHRKRWSQVMYMYYLLGHRLMELPIDVARKAVMAENTYILALDGDINFRPHAVQLLVDLMKKNRGLGAACGRIHPVGAGPMAWYQKFEYAIGHWLQKATEHMIGCVLCSPGCFSLFRAKALMDDNVMKKYTTEATEALHYVQYDQGEDRWLCTLLLQRGYRVEYSAASDAYTHCPEGFGEFYTQRRRWAPSTMANIMDLLGDYKRTVAINDNISLPYIIYQSMLMVGTVLGPGTIFLMLVGAMVASFRISNWDSFYYNIIPILFFMIICFTTKNDIQILVAQILSAGYALLMMAVLVGTAIQIAEDGAGSPSAIFLLSLSGSMVVAALMHPQEFSCVIPGFIYLMSIPSMYLLLILYSLINLNVVAWGTRETIQKKTQKELEEERKALEEEMKLKKNRKLLGLFDLNDDEGGVFGISNLFTCMICSNPRNQEEKLQLASIGESLHTFGKKLHNLERQLEHIHGIVPFDRRKSSRPGRSASRATDHGLSVVNESDGELSDVSDHSDTDSTRTDMRPKRDDLRNPYWIEDEGLKHGEVEALSDQETTFWKDMIKKYLYPIDENKEQQARIARDLIELRNKVVFAFIMFNALFILIVFLLQLNKKQLHINWPLGVKTNITFIPDTSQVIIEKEYLQLEPIGLIFVIFFGIITLVQFMGMCFHRFETLSHMLASIELTCFSPKVEDASGDAFIDKNGVQIAKQLQKLRGIDDESDGYKNGSDNCLARRKTIQNLEKRRNQRTKTGTLDVAFQKRFLSISAEQQNNGSIGGPMLNNLRRISRNRDTLRALEIRKNTVLAHNRSKMETLGANNTYAPSSRGAPRYREKAENLFGNGAERVNHAYEIGDEEVGMQIYGETGRRRESLYGDVDDGKV